MRSVLAFFAWMAVCAVVSWRTAFHMPDGFGNAIFTIQLVAALASAMLVAQLSARSVGAGTALFVIATIVGWRVDRALGLPIRHQQETRRAAHLAVKHATEVDPCRARVVGEAGNCTLRYRATAARDHIELALQTAVCPRLPALSACVTRAAAHFSVNVSPRELASFAYAGTTGIELVPIFVRGTGVPLAERPE